jgi:hypothetical protein
MTTIKIDLKDIEKAATEFSNLDEVKKALKSAQSIKCRIIKQKDRVDYDQEMVKITLREQLLKEVRSYMEPKKITVTTMTQSDIQLLTFDETIKAIKSIQSKKCNEQYNSDKTEYNRALQIEEWLLDHKSNVKPIEDTLVQKSKINDLIDQVENLDSKIDKNWILEQLRNLI